MTFSAGLVLLPFHLRQIAGLPAVANHLLRDAVIADQDQGTPAVARGMQLQLAPVKLVQGIVDQPQQAGIADRRVGFSSAHRFFEPQSRSAVARRSACCTTNSASALS